MKIAKLTFFEKFLKFFCDILRKLTIFLKSAKIKRENFFLARPTITLVNIGLLDFSIRMDLMQIGIGMTSL